MLGPICSEASQPGDLSFPAHSLKTELAGKSAFVSSIRSERRVEGHVHHLRLCPGSPSACQKSKMFLWLGMLLMTEVLIHRLSYTQNNGWVFVSVFLGQCGKPLMTPLGTDLHSSLFSYLFLIHLVLDPQR